MEAFDLRLWPNFTSAGGRPSFPAIVDQISTDSRRIDSPGSLFVALQGNTDGHEYVSHAARAGACYALVKKGWVAPQLPENLQLLQVDDPLKALQEVAKAYRRHLNIPIIALIGSYGKTMVKDLLDQMLRSKYQVAASPESFNSQIGVPLSLLTMERKHEVALIEAAFSKPDEMTTLTSLIGPSHVILTHMGKKHLCSMGSVEAITAECVRLLKNTTPEKWVLLPDDPLIAPFLQDIPAKRYFWNQASAHVPHAHLLPAPQTNRMPFRVDFPDGTHHLGHVTHGFYYFIDLINMAMKAAWLMGVSSAEMSRILTEYTPEPMRTEIWKSPAGTTFINDVYCSDPQSIDGALKHFQLASPSSRHLFIFHGVRGASKLSEASYRRIGNAIAKSSVCQLLLVGNDSYGPLIKELRRLAPSTDILSFSSLNKAYENLQTSLQKDDVVLIKGKQKLSLDELAEAFDDSVTNNQCIINLAAINSNIEIIKKKLPLNTRLMVIVKALAYGTDDVRMARFLTSCGVDILGVSYVEEGAALKRAGVDSAIFVINAGVYEAAKVVKWDLQVGVSEEGLIKSLEKEAQLANRRIKLHLHVNTGMSRLGCRPEEALDLAKMIMQSSHLELEGIMTHFSSSEDPAEDAFTKTQVDIFCGVISQLAAHQIHPKWKHAANSSAALRFDFQQFNMARIGLAVYGLHASKETQKKVELRLAFSLLSRIVGINTCKRGESVSYGRSYRVSKEEQRFAVLPMGYFDGLHRNYSGKGHVVIRGQKAPMVGNITMDYMMVDVTDIPHAAIGDPVLLFGEDEYGHHVSPEDFAFTVDSIPHEIITCLGPRIQRIFVYEETHEKKNTLGAYHGSLPTAT